MTERLQNAGQQASLDKAYKEIKRGSTNSENVVAFWQAFWAENGAKASLTLSVPDHSLRERELKEAKRNGQGLIYVPSQLATQETRHLLGSIFPETLISYSVQEGNPVTNDAIHSGWRLFDMSIEAPYLNTNEYKLRRILARKGFAEPTLNEYIVAGQASKLLTGKYLDQRRTFSRILGSRHGGVVRAAFDSDGHLFVDWFWLPGDRSPNLGGRSSRGVS